MIAKILFYTAIACFTTAVTAATIGTAWNHFNPETEYNNTFLPQPDANLQTRYYD